MKKYFQYIMTNAKLIFLVLFVLSLAFCRRPATNEDSGANKPLIVVENLHLCVLSDSKWISVDAFSNRENQHVCASVESDASPIRLTLIIQEEGDIFSTAFTDAAEFVNGDFSFRISPGLMPGKYSAKIFYARRTLAEITFDTLEN